MTCLTHYTPPEPGRWTGRIDDLEDRDAFRWHQVIEDLDLSASTDGMDVAPSKGFCLLGYCCDRGVELNLGRTGADKGPEAIRAQLANLPVSFPRSVGLYDGGGIHCRNGDLQAAQRSLGEAVKRVLSLGLFPVVLGGGHDLAFGQYLGISRHLPSSKRLGVLNFDAHLDLRPLRSGATSGTMFTQIEADCRERGADFSYFCVGPQKSANTVKLFRTAEELSVGIVLARDMDDADLAPVKKRIDDFVSANDAIYLTICADVFSSAHAPGVSAPQPFGLHPETVLRLFKHALASGKVVSFDVAEVSPRFDSDDNTAKLAAVFVYALVNTVALGHFSKLSRTACQS
ncbi:MAG: formimidoylglutamase [Acidobacteriota bacterium]